MTWMIEIHCDEINGLDSSIIVVEKNFNYGRILDVIKVAGELNNVPCFSLPLPRIIIVFGISLVNTSPSSSQKGRKHEVFIS